MKSILQNFRAYTATITALCTTLLLPLVTSADLSWTIENPLGNITSIEELLLAILNVFIVIATPIIVLFIIYAGFMYVTAKGNAEQIQTATRALTYAIVGAVLILGAVALAEVIKNVVDAFRA